MSRLTVEGTVVRKPVNPGSKSAREAVVLVVQKREYTLRRSGESPYGDLELEKLVGKRLRATGIVSAGDLIMSSFEEIE